MRLEGTSLKSDFVKFVVPSVVAQWVFALYTMVDGIFVAKGVSEVSLTAVNIVTPYIMALYVASILFAVGTSTIVAILLGQKKEKSACEVFTQNIVGLVIVSMIITAAVLCNLERVALFLGATETNMQYVLDYLGAITPFSGLFILCYSFETLIKTDGYPKIATMIVTTGALLNVVLDYLMVMRWNMGIRGAAVATGISNLVLIGLYLTHFLGKKGVIKFTRFRWNFPLIWRQIRNGISSGITELSTGAIIFLFNQMILRYLDESALVSYTIISYMNSIVIMSMVGIVQGYQPLVSYHYGKEQPDICRKLFLYGVAAVTAVTAAAGIVCLGFADGIVGLFLSRDMTALYRYTVQVLRIFALSFLVAGYNVVISGYFTAVEYAAAATVISLSRSLVVLLGSLVLLTMVFGGEGIWWSPLLSECITLMLTVGFLVFG